MRASIPLRLAAVLAAVLGTCALAGCGSSPGCQEKCQQGGPANTTAPPTAGARLGCGTYCQQAAPGAGPSQPGAPSLRIETSGTVRPVAGAIPIRVRCLLPRPCQGYIIVFSDVSATLLARSDLDIPAGSSRTFAIPFTPSGEASTGRRPQPALVRADDELSTIPRSSSCPICHGAANEVGRWSGQIDQKVVLAAP